MWAGIVQRRGTEGRSKSWVRHVPAMPVTFGEVGLSGIGDTEIVPAQKRVPEPKWCMAPLDVARQVRKAAHHAGGGLVEHENIGGDPIHGQTDIPVTGSCCMREHEVRMGPDVIDYIIVALVVAQETDVDVSVVRQETT